jgi:hypothetical protein
VPQQSVLPQWCAGLAVPKPAPSELVLQGIWSGCGEDGVHTWSTGAGATTGGSVGTTTGAGSGAARVVGVGKGTGAGTGAFIGLIVGIVVDVRESRTGAAGTLRSGAVELAGSRLSRTLVILVSVATLLRLRGAKGEPDDGCFRPWRMSWATRRTRSMAKVSGTVTCRGNQVIMRSHSVAHIHT